MNARRQHFVRAYLGEANGNGSKAAILAGYSPRTAKQTASRLLTCHDVKQAIARIAEKADTSTAKALERVSRIANREPKEFTGSDVLKANELILKVNGALKDKHGESRITVNIGFLTNTGPAAIQVTTDEAAATVEAVVMPQRSQLALSGD